MTGEELDQPFTRFFRAAKAHSSTIPGAGLGLAITKSIMENHRGHVVLASSGGLAKLPLSMLSMGAAECERLPTRGGNTMGLGDKIGNAAEKAGGKGKETAGSATGDESLKAEGRARLFRVSALPTPTSGGKGEKQGATHPGRDQCADLTFPRKIPTMMTEVWEMGSEENAAVVRRAYEAFIAGDMGTLMEQYAEDAVWHVGGSGPMAGDKKGRDAILAYFGEHASRTNGSLKITLEDVTAGDRYTIGVHTYYAERDGKSINQRSVLVSSVSGGKVTEVFEMHEDTAKTDSFWS